MNKVFLFSLILVAQSCDSKLNTTETTKFDGFAEIESNLLHGINGIILGDSENIKLNKIRSLFVKECFGSSCTGNTYKFDSEGNVVYFTPSFNSSVSVYKYDSNKNIVESTYEFNSYDRTDLSIIKYYYRGDSIFSDSKSFEGDSLVYESKSSGIKSENRKTIRIKLENGNITQQLLKDDLGFPCGDIYKGSHIVYYDYFDNGLISEFSITDSMGDTIRRFEYDYGVREN